MYVSRCVNLPHLRRAWWFHGFTSYNQRWFNFHDSRSRLILQINIKTRVNFELPLVRINLDDFGYPVARLWSVVFLFFVAKDFKLIGFPIFILTISLLDEGHSRNEDILSCDLVMRTLETYNVYNIFSRKQTQTFKTNLPKNRQMIKDLSCLIFLVHSQS